MKNDTLIMLKVIRANNTLVTAFEDSYRNQVEHIYKVKSKKDIELLQKVLDDEIQHLDKMLAVFVFSENGQEYQVDDMYLGYCSMENGIKEGIRFKIDKKIDAELVINNVLSYSELDLKNDFERHSYINVEYSKALIMQLQELMIKPSFTIMTATREYQSRAEEEYLHEYAQRNEHCQRMWNSETAEQERSEFQRDRERIVNSKAFRRMVDKAQIFTSSKGDHYRTRMTHTLEVAQIARSIANSLKLNIDLTEAIALGHDLGHTPFGHQGERTLADIINGKTDALQKLAFEKNNPYGGFKHNFQSLRMLSKLEEKYVEHPGLDVSFQVLEGVLKHTSHLARDCQNCRETECQGKCCDYAEFVDSQIKDYLYLEYKFATTLEGQVVALADEIAQRSHDIDDAFSSSLLTFAEFQDYLKLSKMKPLAVVIENTYKKVEEYNNRMMTDQQEMLTARVTSDIIGYLVNDVVDSSREKMKYYDKSSFYCEKHRFDKQLVDFSGEGAEVCSLLDKLISKRAINCLEVTRFDRNASKVVKSLFKAYYENPKLIHAGTLRRMYIDMLQYTDNTIDFVKGDPKLVKAEFNKITNYCFPEKEEMWGIEDKEYYQKRKILIRHIVDFIAGMTDSYAMNEFRRLNGIT